jgi:Na+-transporting NADH:ubiquinone oxidoreductase subunit B
MSTPFGILPTSGGFAFGTVFVATDPTTSQAAKGKWVYGFLVGLSFL